MHVRSVHDPVLGVITTAELQSRLDAHDSKMSTAARVKDTPETRALHFSNNGTQNRQSLEAIQARGTFPQERIEKLIESIRTGATFYLPQGCTVVAEGARLCIQCK